MKIFRRDISPKFLDRLRALAETDGNWWRDLLSQWAPSGQHGTLRLAVRNSYLNFYAKGQSIALVALSGDEPILRIHRKYVTGKSSGPQSHVALRSDRGVDSSGREGDWGGPRMLSSWIANASRPGQVEKRLIDDAVAVTPSVIDLEMGIPSGGPRSSAVRMDMVALERDDNAMRIVFWEAKRSGDKRLRSIAPQPEVIRKQLAIYRTYLSSDENRRAVVTAYRETCRLMLEFRSMAAAVGNVVALDPSIEQAAADRSCLEVDANPRILIFEEREKRDAVRWATHLGKLSEDGTRVLVQTAGAHDIFCAGGKA